MTRLGQPTFTRILRTGLDEGVRFLDSADLYGSHAFIREAVKGVPRDRYSVLNEAVALQGGLNEPSAVPARRSTASARSLGTEMLDVRFIHCMQNDKWPEQFARVRDELSKLKDEGAVRAVGVSCHDHGALKRAADLPWVDVILARINHRGGEKFMCDDTVEAISATLRRARANGKTVVGMKIFGAGTLTKPEERQASLKYVLGEGLVDAMTIGMSDPAQVTDNVRWIGKTLSA
ncbi:MAG: aldo/keto reductase [Vicinamibacteria bacterium]